MDTGTFTYLDVPGFSTGGFPGTTLVLTRDNPPSFIGSEAIIYLTYDSSRKGGTYEGAGAEEGTFSFSKLVTVIPPATLAGLVYTDANGNGRQDGTEKPRAGAKVFLDTDRDHRIDAGETVVTTDAKGKYQFAGLKARTYRVEVVAPAEHRASNPVGGYTSTALTTGNTSRVSFGLTQRASVSGTLFQDTDGDKKADAGELRLTGWRVYQDADNDARFDAGEESSITDANGNWSF